MCVSVSVSVRVSVRVSVSGSVSVFVSVFFCWDRPRSLARLGGAEGPNGKPKSTKKRKKNEMSSAYVSCLINTSSSGSRFLFIFIYGFVWGIIRLYKNEEEADRYLLTQASWV